MLSRENWQRSPCQQDAAWLANSVILRLGAELILAAGERLQCLQCILPRLHIAPPPCAVQYCRSGTVAHQLTLTAVAAAFPPHCRLWNLPHLRLQHLSAAGVVPSTSTSSVVHRASANSCRSPWGRDMEDCRPLQSPAAVSLRRTQTSPSSSMKKQYLTQACCQSMQHVCSSSYRLWKRSSEV